MGGVGEGNVKALIPLPTFRRMKLRSARRRSALRTVVGEAPKLRAISRSGGSLSYTNFPPHPVLFEELA